MSNSDKLDACKKEIRSILIAYQKGCYLTEFHRAYRELIGRRLPFRELGFSADTELLYSMPDVVRITPYRGGGGEYHLQVVADEKSKHILKMVARQKPAKLKPPPPIRSSRSLRSYDRYVLPPRFSEVKRMPEPQITHKVWAKEPEVPPKTVPKVEPKLPPKTSPREEVISLVEHFNNRLAIDDVLCEYQRMYNKNLPISKYGFSTIQECIDVIPELEIVCKNNVTFVRRKSASHNEDKNVNDKDGSSYKSPLPEVSSTLNSEYDTSYKSHLPEVTSTVSSEYNNTSYKSHLPEVTSTFSSEYNTSYKSHLPQVSSTLNSEYYNASYKSHIPETSSTFNSEYDTSYNSQLSSSFVSEYNDSHISDKGNLSLREKLKQVAERFPEGIWASDFPNYFEEETGDSFELKNLGFRCLSDLVDSVPDILIRKPVAGSKKDYRIFSADRESVNGSSLVENIVLNLRKILEAYPEGIKMNQVFKVYETNCKNPLHIEDLGFDNLETFLLSIKNRVPLKFGSFNGERAIHLVKLIENPADLYHVVPEAYNQETIPFDAVFPEFEYKPFTFPPNFDFSKFTPAYTSSVAHAGQLYIQPQIDETAQTPQRILKLSAELNKFYNGSQSDEYKMKNIHIKVGISCIAKWPFDQHWYRAKVLSISSMETVRVHYVDYGNRDTIPTSLLRYTKKEFVDLPIQAIRCRLAYLKPPKNVQKWDTHSKSRILELCEDVPLMAKIETIGSDGVYPVLLCDTNGEEDIYINDVLRNEGLADYDIAEPNENIPISPEPKITPEYHHNLHPLQAIQAQCFLKAFAAVAPSFAQNENYVRLLQEVTVYCQNPDPLHQNTASLTPSLGGPPGFDSVIPNMNSFANSMLYNTYPGATLDKSTLKPPKADIIPPPVSTADFFSPSPAYRSSPEALLEESVNGDNDIFDDDDDDEMFQQFCQKVTLGNIRYVKRVVLGDGYKIHVIVVDSEPYASSGDISQLIWNNKESDYLLQKLQVQDVDIPALSLSEDGHEELFKQLSQFNVKGVQETTGFKSSVVLYPLKAVIQILNLFGHPSLVLRTKLTEEIATFNPNDKHWREFSPDITQSDDEDCFPGVTDDDKLERLCLFDLKAMKESIVLKRKTMLSHSDLKRSIQSDEINKLEHLHKKVLLRIQEIEEICKFFA